MTFVLAGLLIAVSFVAILFMREHFKDVKNHREISEINAGLTNENEQCKQEYQKWQKISTAVNQQNKRLEEWKKYLNADEEAKKIIAQAKQVLQSAKLKEEEIVANAQKKANESINAAMLKADYIRRDTESSLANVKKDIELNKKICDDYAEKISESHKTYQYRKTLPDTHEKLKTRYDELKAKFDQIKEELKEAKISGKESALSSKEKDKFLAQFDKLARTYIEDNFKFVISKMTTNNFTASRDRVLKAIQLCRSIGFDLPENTEEEYTDKIRDEFKRVLRIEEMRLEQQRIKEQIREEQKAMRELKKLEEKEQQAIKERQAAEESRAAMQRAIEEALANAHGEHTSQIQEMEKALAEKDAEIAAKQQEIEDNQRAISNAQITKAGHVYVLSNIGSFGDGIFKIGMTRRNDPQDRVNELGDASVPFPFDVHLMVGCDNAPDLEKTLHRRFNNMRVNRVNLRKEYFRVNVNEVRSEIQTFLGKDVDYIADPSVMEEYAEQYRQSQSATLEDMEEVEKLYQEAGVDIDGEESED